ncbi:MAG: SpoIID/LytB domain-containing protein [Caldilineaceae bacterium]
MTVVPLGTETAFLARTRIYDLTTDRLRLTFPGHTPQWLDNGRILQLETMARGLVYYLIDGTIREVAVSEVPDDAARALSTNRNATVPGGEYPSTIRVAHHPSNGCRDVPEWQIDIIPFEEYVARVVPAETPSWWPVDALAAQAVAARTYAWRQILVGRADYDVTDWANFQMMCDARYPNSDNAAKLTEGQYLAALADPTAQPISAMYSAENGHPTLTNPYVSYLQSVPDLFALGRTRWGHGYGLSQWGAYRRAQAGHNYRQILGHYYSNIYLRDALDGTRSHGALLGSATTDMLATESLFLRTIAPPTVTAQLVITTDDGITTALAVDNQQGIVWRAPATLADGGALTATLWISGARQQETIWHIDRQPPPVPEFKLPELITTTALTLVVPADTGTPLLSANWQWEGEDLPHTPNSGMAVADGAATNGTTWLATPAEHGAGVWYGPYTQDLPPGHSYRALFWLRSNIPSATVIPATPIAHLDVTDNEGREILGMHDLRANDFRDANRYQPVAVDFHLFTVTQGIEFRVAWAGQVALALDRIEVWQLPDALERPALDTATQRTEASFGWTLPAGRITSPIAVRATDSAGNVSSTAIYTATLADHVPPLIVPRAETTTWFSTQNITLTAAITDTGSGVDIVGGIAQISGATLAPSATITVPATITLMDQSPYHALLRATVNELTDGTYMATLFARDRAGNRAERTFPLLVDTTAPEVTMTASGDSQGSWFLAPLTVTLSAIDSGSGVAAVYYHSAGSAFNRAEIALPMREDATVHLQEEGIYTVTAWAVDRASNQSTTSVQRFQLDLTPPTVLLSQSVLTTDTVRVAWWAADAGAGVAELEIEVRHGDQAWEIVPSSSRTSAVATVDIPVDAKEQTQVRARARDHVGHIGEWVELDLWIATDSVFLPLISR